MLSDSTYSSTGWGFPSYAYCIAGAHQNEMTDVGNLEEYLLPQHAGSIWGLDKEAEAGSQ